MSTFQGYRPLSEATKEIRLLTINPAAEPAPRALADSVSCTLRTIELRDANPFYALSYVWGREPPTLAMTIDGQTILIRRTLWLFLHTLRARFGGQREFRDPSTSLFNVWIDSICIDQNNARERSFQVSMMGEVYRSADAIYAWLGEALTEHDDGMQCVAEIASMRAKHRPWYRISEAHENNFARIQSIASRPYWTRLWIKQEVLLARDLWFFLGKDVVNWQELHFAATLRHGSSRHPATLRRAGTLSAGIGSKTNMSLTDMLSLLNLRDRQSDTFALPNLIVRFADAGCMDGRDRIYALLALVDRKTSGQIVVDYDKPLLQVLLENYSHWAESPPKDSTAEPNLYHMSSIGHFCTHMSRVLSNADLEEICSSSQVREAVTARVAFKTSALCQISSVRAVASMDANEVKPATASFEQCSKYGFVTSVTWVSRSPPGSFRNCIVYADTVPDPGEYIAWIGSRVLFFRQRGLSASDIGPHTSSLILVGIGTEMLDTSSTAEESERLSAQLLMHPCLWQRQRLPDASFTVIESDTTQVSASATVSCNAAATALLLLESRQGKSHSERRRHHTSDLGTYTDHSEDLQVWSPFVFGRDAGLLEACRVCRTVGRSMFSPPNRHPLTNVSLKCECKWLQKAIGSN